MTQTERDLLESQLAPDAKRYYDALVRIGRLTRWVGWMEVRRETGAADMREIHRIVEEETGLGFPEYT